MSAGITRINRITFAIRIGVNTADLKGACAVRAGETTQYRTVCAIAIAEMRYLAERILSFAIEADAGNTYSAAKRAPARGADAPLRKNILWTGVPVVTR
ncbi:hypothetical protein GM31_03180 [Trabulsiella odontotermitis]|uniref:Uncharacterized protein n=1 Tax=Trabulsiella odontotermitis TaxID=379893 RepID=A0A0L0GQA4_9ENTR|nr:hypothetical protein GM31_03180 [Trabulsiella odontotermitis]